MSLWLTFAADASAWFGKSRSDANSLLASGQGILFYYIFDSTPTLQPHYPALTISTGRNQTLALDFAEVGRVLDSLKAVPDVIRITNKGPASTLIFTLVNDQDPFPGLFHLTNILAVPSTVSFAAGESKLIGVQYKLLALISLPGIYAGHLLITDTATGYSLSVPVSLLLNLLL